jgi:hypothetical protein
MSTFILCQFDQESPKSDISILVPEYRFNPLQSTNRFFVWEQMLLLSEDEPPGFIDYHLPRRDAPLGRPNLLAKRREVE